MHSITSHVAVVCSVHNTANRGQCIISMGLLLFFAAAVRVLFKCRHVRISHAWPGKCILDRPSAAAPNMIAACLFARVRVWPYSSEIRSHMSCVRQSQPHPRPVIPFMWMFAVVCGCCGYRAYRMKRLSGSELDFNAAESMAWCAHTICN